ncbi:tRNA-splicing endonuclease subunit Sen54p [[Candida] jaroonii]|uniref:tRNA-splicing endonuclease subunit Sen54p n=1 Tax=[Candida] jaroonii TaxID=467808 RepID=A0ACA9Y1Q1_9ASCO|nr:tRNA-splicing endonuclease subunit Sen54p [[Candida] jaroonii]
MNDDDFKLDIEDEEVYNLKDFEPDGTDYQQNKLSNSLDLIYSLISEEIKTHEKNCIVGIYLKTQETIILKPKGNFFRDFGYSKTLNGNIYVFLNKLESLYLLQRGNLIIYLGNEKFNHYLDGYINNFNVNELYSLNLQHFYSFLCSSDLKKYQVFAYLKRLGYLIKEYDGLKNHPPPIFQIGVQDKSMYQDIFTKGFRDKHYFGYKEIFERLRVIPSAQNFESLQKNYESDFEIHFNVWKPRNNFSKKNLPVPDFMICMVDEFPKINDVYSLLNKVIKPEKKSDTKPKSNKVQTRNNLKKDKEKTERDKERERERERDFKLKNNGRNVILAKVDNGVNFISLSEMDFESVSLY